jgi:hypothetical protein
MEIKINTKFSPNDEVYSADGYRFEIDRVKVTIVAGKFGKFSPKIEYKLKGSDIWYAEELFTANPPRSSR